MRWELLSKSEVSALPKATGALDSSHLPLILIEENAKTGLAALSGLVLLSDQELAKIDAEIPALVFLDEELKESESWKEILHFHAIPKMDLARYHKLHSEIPVECLLEALGEKVNYQSIEDFEELGHLTNQARDLSLRYGFSLNVLRLWDRIPQEEQKRWRSIWEGRKIKKNLIREIIEYYYDLSDEKRRDVLQKAEQLDQGWGSTKAVFPSGKLRDLVYEARFPRSAKLRQKAQKLLRELRLPKKLNLELPQGLEAHELELRIRFSDPEELQRLVESLSEPRRKQILGELFKLL